MGSIYNRGTRGNPNWYVAYKDAKGKRKAIPSKQPTKAQARKFLEQIEARIASGMVAVEKPPDSPPCRELMTTWVDSLRNRNAVDDRSKVRRHVMPAFGDMRLDQITLAEVMKWIDRQRAAGELADATLRHNLNLLSRFFSWAIERGHATVNPVRQIPTGKRPKQSPKKLIPWLEDDGLVKRIIAVLPTPVDYMFYLGNRSGMRTGEITGLRMCDIGFLDEGVIRVRHSYDKPLKEDKYEQGKVKWVPAADDCAAFLDPWLGKRRAAGMGSHDLVFPGPKFPRRPCRALWIERKWNKLVRGPLEIGLTWYQATRHTFTSRLLAAGASLDEVSAALGHSSPVVTRRYYDHFIRRRYSANLRGGLGLGDAGRAGASDEHEKTDATDANHRDDSDTAR